VSAGLHGTVRQSGQGRTIVFVHGFVSTHATWDRVIDAMDEDVFCVSYDLRGHGKAPMPDGVFRLDDLVDDIESLRKSVGVEQVDVVGQSLGGMIAAAYTARFPQRTATLTLIATPAFRSDAARQRVRDLGETIRQKGVRGALSAMVASWYRDDAATLTPGVIEARIEEITGLDREAVLLSAALYAEIEIGPWLAGIAAPILIMTGEHAVGCDGAFARDLHARLPGSSLAIVEGFKNGLLTEAPERVAAELRRFLDRNPVKSM